MPTYSLQTSTGPLDLAPFSYPAPREDRLRSVGSTRQGPEPIESPSGLQRDAIRAAERLALDLLAASGDAQRVEVVKTLADGTSRVDAEATAVLDPRDAGYAIVESADRGARSCKIAAIVEEDGERRYSAPVAIAQDLAGLVVGEDGDEETAVAIVAEERGLSEARVRLLARHGVAIARAQADLARSGRSPLVAVVR